MNKWDLKELDCSRMLINPQSPKMVTFMETNIPSLKSLDFGCQAKVFTKAQIYRFILLMYDPESPIGKMHSLDHYEKKYESCAYAKFELSKGRDGYMRFDSRVDDMVLGKNDAVNDAVILFLGYVKNPQWDYLVFLRESMLGFTRDAIGKKNRDAKTSKEYRALYEDFFKVSNEVGHIFEETEEFVSRFYSNIEKSRLAIRPEDYAEAFANGDDLRADNPYSVNYAVDKIRFLGDDEEQVRERLSRG